MAQTDAALTELRDAVAAQGTVVEGIKTYIAGLASQLEANADDPDEIRAIAATVRSQSETLASAMIENTGSSEEDPTTEPNPDTQVPATDANGNPVTNG